MFAERNPEFETRIESVAVDFANVVVHAARAQHRAGNAGVDREIGGKFADVLRARDQDFVSERSASSNSSRNAGKHRRSSAPARSNLGRRSTRQPPKRM